MPEAYDGAQYDILPSTGANETHWKLDVVCRSCSQWPGPLESQTQKLSPIGNIISYAFDTQAPEPPASPEATIMYHGYNKGQFGLDFQFGQQANFDEIISKALANM